MWSVTLCGATEGHDQSNDPWAVRVPLRDRSLFIYFKEWWNWVRKRAPEQAVLVWLHVRITVVSLAEICGTTLLQLWQRQLHLKDTRNKSWMKEKCTTQEKIKRKKENKAVVAARTRIMNGKQGLSHAFSPMWQCKVGIISVGFCSQPAIFTWMVNATPMPQTPHTLYKTLSGMMTN